MFHFVCWGGGEGGDSRWVYLKSIGREVIFLLSSWIGNNFIFITIDLSAVVKQIGPNVSISANARIGAGVRLISCIILDDVEIKVYNQIKGYDMHA